MPNQDQLDQMRNGAGFIAALDQSGGSTPKALAQYGVSEDAYSGEEEMYDQIHAMRSRIATAPAFTGDKVIGAILFEMTMDRAIEGKPAAAFLWGERHVVPFLKVDKGLADEENGCQVMKPMPNLDALLDRAVAAGIFGTKMRSLISQPNAAGIKAVVDQQFEVARQIIAKGLVPIIEPEVSISCPEKADAEDILLEELSKHLDMLGDDELVMLKLTIPTIPNHYGTLINHPKVVRVVALSGGYERDKANALLAENTGMIASFSRALTEGLTVDMTDDAFNAAIGAAIESIYQASIT